MEDCMKILNFIMISAICLISFVSCGGSEGDVSTSQAAGKTCESNLDCPLGYTCDIGKKICTDGSESGNGNSDGNGGNSENGENGGGNSGNGEGEGGGSGDGGNSGQQDGDGDPITGKCTPGKKQTCDYEGPDGTEGKGPCKAAIRECREDGTWTPCEGEVLPVPETDDLCSDGIDNDCDGTVDNGADLDGDGFGACSDCCDTTDQCPSPKDAWDPEIHKCTYDGEVEISENCDSELSEGSISSADYENAVNYAKAIGLCKMKDENDPNDWGLISATITDPTGGSAVHKESHGLLSAFGNVIKPNNENGLMLALTSGKVGKKMSGDTQNCGTDSGAPSDWLNGEVRKGKFPAAASCPSSGTSGTVHDAVMLTLKIKTPKTAKSFSFNIYFLTAEYPAWICSSYNDFFIALLDSKYDSDDPNLKNPADTNLAMDSLGNPVGVNLAPGGLFTQCKNKKTSTYEVTSCVGTEDLQGTGWESHGGTGWLTTRGNVKGGEVITLRLAIWDLNDHAYDSLVLIDNFKWGTAEQKPGTGL